MVKKVKIVYNLEMTKIKYKESPPVGKNYRKLFFARKPGVPENGKLQELELILPSMKINTEVLQSYNTLCCMPELQYLPITFPYVLAGPLHLSLLSHPLFPLKGAGLLHLRNKIKCSKKLSKDESFDLKVRPAATRFRPQGFEFDIETELWLEDSLTWQCTSTLLSRGKFTKEDPASKDENTFVKLEHKGSESGFKVPGNAGRAYAKVCKDYNPIHLATPLAWLFGFKKSIAHGMWVSARALGEMNLTEISEFDLAFKGPFIQARLYPLSEIKSTLIFSVRAMIDL